MIKDDVSKPLSPLLHVIATSAAPPNATQDTSSNFPRLWQYCTPRSHVQDISRQSLQSQHCPRDKRLTFIFHEKSSSCKKFIFQKKQKLAQTIDNRLKNQRTTTRANKINTALLNTVKQDSRELTTLDPRPSLSPSKRKRKKKKTRKSEKTLFFPPFFSLNFFRNFFFFFFSKKRKKVFLPFFSLFQKKLFPAKKSLFLLSFSCHFSQMASF